jgi:DNA-directed RNA polymerase specialized sigma24 family protein
MRGQLPTGQETLLLVVVGELTHQEVADMLGVREPSSPSRARPWGRAGGDEDVVY